MPYKSKSLCAITLLLAACATKGAGGGADFNPDAGATGSDGADDVKTPSVGGGTDGQEFPLLGSKRGGHYWFDFCEGKSDDTPVPQDPRELVVPGVSDGKAVMMNAYWQTCQDDDHPGTCGELRARTERGYRLIAGDGEMGAGTVFGGDTAGDGSLLKLDVGAMFAMSADAYNKLWKVWGLDERPDNFDQLAAERWGMSLSPTGNPYPLEGEDPNATNGGSGQLPMALTQLRKSDGTYTGKLSVTCNVCHSGKVGEMSDGPGLGPLYGTNSVGDLVVMFTDLGKAQVLAPELPMLGALGIFALNKIRGTGNITNFQFFGMLEVTGHIREALPAIIAIQAEPSTGTEDAPVWWNVGHRPVKFFDGAQVADSKRIELSFHLPNAPIHGALPPGGKWEEDSKWITDHMQDSDAWIASLRSPAWPENKLGAIDIKLAEQGAILFHSKDLWADGLNNPTDRPEGGNGSCASCHGAYSPRYVNDPDFLASPLLEGVASYIAPLEIINTDPQRLAGNSVKVQDASRAAWFAYNDGPLNENGAPLCGNWNDPALRGDRALGYLAPPLYGVWATAPYFHNGAVPSVREVLFPAERKTIWRRVSTKPRADQSDLVMGFTTTLADYDTATLGWKYEALECGQDRPVSCEKSLGETVGDTLKPLIDALNTDEATNMSITDIGLLWNLANMPLLTDQQVENRKIYNTTVYSQSNRGHAFTSVLSDAEARAIIEYLKTL